MALLLALVIGYGMLIALCKVAARADARVVRFCNDTVCNVLAVTETAKAAVVADTLTLFVAAPAFESDPFPDAPSR